MTTYSRTPVTPFRPRPVVRGTAMQQLLAQVRPRAIDLVRDEQPLLLDAGYDYTGVDPAQPVRLLGYYNRSRQPGAARGLVLLLHGWEGSSHSNFVSIVGQRLVEEGYDIFRLNMRDHGPGLHIDPYALNQGIFLGVLIDEAAAVTHQIARMAGDAPFYIMGGSMGGNFALRLARRHTEEPFHNLRRVIAVCPAVNPARATDAMDARPAMRLYFRRRWLRSLRAKQRLYPQLYDFTALEEIPRVRDMTEWLLQRYGHLARQDFRTADDYFAAYAVPHHALNDLRVRTTIITAMDDPVIPVVDFYALAPHPLLDVQIHETGGHMGFVDAMPVRHRLPDLVMAELRRP